jgi:hypothetical protein
MIASWAIAVPTGVKIFNWIGTMWMGRIRYEPPMLFAIGFIGTFLIGGLSGIFLAAFPVDWQLTQTYYVVAHIHYVLFGGSMFAIFGGLVTATLTTAGAGAWRLRIGLVQDPPAIETISGMTALAAPDSAAPEVPRSTTSLAPVPRVTSLLTSVWPVRSPLTPFFKSFTCINSNRFPYLLRSAAGSCPGWTIQRISIW